jgi:hypothetical protein
LLEHQTQHGAQYGVFVCPACRDDPSDACYDSCGQEHADDLPPLWMGSDAWPACRCCGRPMQRDAPLATA